VRWRLCRLTRSTIDRRSRTLDSPERRRHDARLRIRGDRRDLHDKIAAKIFTWLSASESGDWQEAMVRFLCDFREATLPFRVPELVASATGAVVATVASEEQSAWGLGRIVGQPGARHADIDPEVAVIPKQRYTGHYLSAMSRTMRCEQAKGQSVKITRQVVVFDTADLEAESSFWAEVLGGKVVAEDDWHSVVDAEGEWRMGFQLAPDHVPPIWPGGPQHQQIHLDIHVDDQASAHDDVIALGARLLKSAADVEADDGFQVYADPAGHPFCICWGG
jgi:catechol 2,3-dioxygenase-like lactoylglutathione lyase family enzyme